MPKGHSVFRCTECGADQPKWGGRCDACGAWNSLVEEPIRRTVGRSDRRTASSDSQTVRLSDLGSTKLQRWQTGLAEFDFVLGGGIVPGAVVLVGGEPGIRKRPLARQGGAAAG